MWKKIMAMEQEHRRILIIVLALVVIGSGFFVGIQVKNINGKEEEPPLVIKTDTDEGAIQEDESEALVIVYVSGAVKSPGVYELKQLRIEYFRL